MLHPQGLMEQKPVSMKTFTRPVYMVALACGGILALWADIEVYAAVSPHSRVWAWVATVVVFIVVAVLWGVFFETLLRVARRKKT